MKKKIMVLLECLISVCASAQSPMIQSFQSLGFENLSEGKTADYDWFALEDRVNRNTYAGLGEAVRLIIDDHSVQRDVSIILLDNNLPQVKASLSYKLIEECRNGMISIQDVYRGMTITYDTDDYRDGGDKGRIYNRSSGRVDFVLYPQIELANYRLDVLYEVIVNISPAIEMELWQGAKFTGQVIFPIYNNLSGESDYIRPGILAVTQQFRLYDNVWGALSVGNFNSGRMGVDARLKYRTNNGRWGMEAQAGMTGSSTFYGGKWQVSNWNKVNYFVTTSYYEPHYNLRLDLGLGQYIYGDRGVRFDCTRYFGDVSIGVFAMRAGGETNGGFHFAFPLPGKKRKRPSHFPVRFRLPEYFDWEYQAQASRKYIEGKNGRIYEIRPDENRSSRFYNPNYIKHCLIYFNN